MSGSLKKGSLALGAMVAAVFLTPAAAEADSLIENVNGITLDSEGKVIRFAAMVIDDDGRDRSARQDRAICSRQSKSAMDYRQWLESGNMGAGPLSDRS